MKKLIKVLLTIFLLLSSHLYAEAKEMQGLFLRDQPRLYRLFEWDDKVIAEAEKGYYKIDTGKMSATPVNVIPDSKLMSLAEAFGKTYIVSKDLSSKNVLMVKEGSDWQPVDIPDELKKLEHLLILGDPTSLVIVVYEKVEYNSHFFTLMVKDHLFRYSDNKWAKVKITENERFKKIWVEPKQNYLLHDDKVYIGVNRGEFGGGLFVIDILKGRTDEITLPSYFDNFGDDGETVQCVRLSKDGTVWVAYGLAHMGGTNGHIGIVKEDKFEMLVANTRLNNDFISQFSSSIKSNRVNWPYDPSAFSAIAFDKNGELSILADDIGILRCEIAGSEDGNFIKVTKRWNPWAKTKRGSMSYLYPQDMMVMDNGIFLVAFGDAGIGLFSKDGELVGRITFDAE